MDLASRRIADLTVREWAVLAQLLPRIGEAPPGKVIEGLLDEILRSVDCHLAIAQQRLADDRVDDSAIEPAAFITDAADDDADESSTDRWPVQWIDRPVQWIDRGRRPGRIGDGPEFVPDESQGEPGDG